MNSLLTDSRASQLHLPDIVGQGYGTFWRFKGRYRVCKGSRASKKSKTTALWYIVNLMKYPQANLLVIRKVYRTLHDSCFTDLKWAISRLGVQAFWDVKESPLELTYKPTGQKILFRGLDDPLKVTSIAAEHGYLCWAWIEEAYEISSEADFNMIDESIRGAIPPETGLFKQVTLTFNPWNEHHWLKARFFDTPDPDTLALTTNYTCNEWLDDADRRVFERMKVQNPRRYSVAGLGEWGIVDGLVFENWVEEVFEKTIIAARPDVKSAFGLDFGYTNDPTAFFCGLVSEKEMTIWVFDELYTGHVIDIIDEQNQTLFDMIQNALDETLTNTGKLFVLYDDVGRLCLRNINQLKLDLVVDAETGESYTYETSIDSQTYDKIKLFYENDKTGKRELYVAQDSSNISKWGVLQYCEQVKTTTGVQAKANSLLKLYNNRTRSLGLKGVFGDPRVRAGCSIIVSLTLPDMTLCNYMVVHKVTHNFQGERHSMDLTLIGGEFISG